MHFDYISYTLISCIYLDVACTSHFEGKVRACLQEGGLSACYFLTACFAAVS